MSMKCLTNAKKMFVLIQAVSKRMASQKSASLDLLKPGLKKQKGQNNPQRLGSLESTGSQDSAAYRINTGLSTGSSNKRCRENYS